MTLGKKSFEELTVTICTLNEEKNIGDCISSIRETGIANILVIDASSQDKTAEIARNNGARVIVVPKNGLSSQRRICVTESKTKYVALLDADHRPTRDVWDILISEMNLFSWDGIEAQIESFENTTYWDSAMEFNFKISHNFVGPRNMIGTPCIYKKAVLERVNFDARITGPSDDTDLCYRLEKAGYRLGVGSAIIKQVHRSTFKEFVRKWIWYGSGDAEFIRRHPNRFLSIVYHQIGNYAIKKSLLAIIQGKPKYVPFFISAGLLRTFGMNMSFLRLLLFNKNPEIYKT